MTEGKMVPVSARTRAKILTYLKDWHGSYWSLHTREREGIAQRIAENVTSYYRLLNLPLFTRVAQEMIDDGTIKIHVQGDGRLAVDVEYLDPEKQD